ncbi:MAG: sigma-70 family RNA polymerase sigma factor [Cytophagaceae bacterium]|nr:sigma-70 family RNA polymerase sigma factor [Cytophagaceae bacterium]
MDSIELVKLLKKEREKGLSCLYDKYAAALNGIVARIVVSEALAEEVLQQVFLKVAHSIDAYETESCSLFTWMSRMARQEALTAQEQQSSEKRITNELHPLVSNTGNDCKDVLNYIYVLGFTPSETAKHLNLTLEEVKTKLRMAVSQLRQSYQSNMAQ